MKRLLFMVALAAALSSCSVGYYNNPSKNNLHRSSIVNISIQPSWGPAGYDYAMYYYFPDFNFYYDVERALFYYPNYGRWVSARVLPPRRGFPTDLHRYYKVVINRHNPWNYNRQHRSRYKIYKGVYTQPTIVDMQGGRPQHNNSYAPRRIPTQQPQAAPPARNNNTQQGYGQATPPAYNNPPQRGTNNAQRPAATGQGSRRNNQQSQGTSVRPQQQSSSSANRSTGTTSSRGNSGSSSTGSRSSGSRGR